MQLTHTGSRFELMCGFADSALPKKAGFRWDQRRKRWFTGNAISAMQFIQHADFQARGVLTAHQEALACSRALDSDILVPCPDGYSLLPFQRAGVAYSTVREHTLNGDEPGLGKTIQAIGHVNKEAHIKRVAVCTMASLKINWQREFQKWQSRNMSVGIADRKTWPSTDAVIFNYESAVEAAEMGLDEVEWDLLVIDEAHFIKNPEAKRTQALLGAWERGKCIIPPVRAKQYLFMTGTPIMNRPKDLWPILRKIDPKGLGASYSAFTERYCDGHMTSFGYDAEGASNLPELQDRLRSTCMVRRLKKDVLSELPAKRRQIIPIPASAARVAAQAELDFYNKHSEAIERAREQVEILQGRGDEASYKKAASQLSSSMKLLFETMSTLRKATGMAKIPFAKSFIEQILLESEKLVVFAHHTEILTQLHASFSNIAALHWGGMTNEAKQEAIDQFTEEPSCRLLFASITAAVGYTATAASRELFVELDWRASSVKQAEDRCDRIGQKDSVLIQYLLFDNSLDAIQIKTILNKLEIEEQALG